MLADEVAELLESLADHPAEAVDEALEAAGVHAVVIWTGPLHSEDEQHWLALAVRAARAAGDHHRYWDRQQMPEWIGLAFYGTYAGGHARHGRDAAEEWNPGTWRVTLGASPEPADVREQEVASRLAAADLLSEAHMIANRYSRVTVAVGVYDPGLLGQLTHELGQLALAGGRPWPSRVQARPDAGTITCSWAPAPEAADAAGRFLAAARTRDPGSWSISTDGPVATS